MSLRLLKLLSVILIVIGASALAQERSAPTTREQVMLSYAPVVKKVSPAVVNIYAKRVVTRRISPFMGDPFFDQFFGDSFRGLNRQQVESSLGSGLIVDKEGVVVTNAHVIKGAQEISVVLADGLELPAKVSLTDESSDLAALRVETNGMELPYAMLQPSESLEVGDIVIAIGNPFGVGQTVTSGIISALARSSLNINDFNFFIQTDAAINPGNSGGPLVSMDGGVIGINTAIFSRSGGSLGIGFAIPSEMVATVIAAEKTGAKTAGVIRPWLGVTGQTVTADIADSLGLNRPQGIVLSRLHKASPARKAGMEVGDVITAINGKIVRSVPEMKFRLGTVPVGEKAQLDFIRKGKEKSVTLVTMAPPDEPPRHETVLEGQHPLSGVKVANINPALAVELGIDFEKEGVVVSDVSEGSRAAGLVRPGDIILAINSDDIEDVKDVEKELKQGWSSAGFDMMLDRGGRKSRIIIR